MEELKYYLATNKQDVFHYGKYNPETQNVTTGQPFYMEFDTEEEWLEELLKYGITPEEEEEI
jgi:uncharacterized protein YqcC (DUF446 family)